MKSLLLQCCRLPVLLLCFLVSCDTRPGDKAIQESVDEKMRANNMYEGITATVADGVVTLSGECDGENCVSIIENKLKQDGNVDSVVNNIRQAAAGLQ